MYFQFFGACKTVTGSQHILGIGNKKILLDCGFYQGHRSDMEYLNRHLPYDPKEIDAMILSHAHIDHCGNIPSLVKHGFQGKIYCTNATKPLTAVMLEDAANIQLHDLFYLNKKYNKVFEPIYTPDDVEPAMKLFVGKDYHDKFEILPGVEAWFQDAGHVLGSALINLSVKEAGKQYKLGFTGDLGRKFLPILRDPEQIIDVDYLISESTYGDRLHDEARTSYISLAETINRTYARGGKIIIPSFALERAQELIYIIHELIDAKAIPPLFVYVDSPLTVKISEIFASFPDLFDEEARQNFLTKGKDPLIFTYLRFIESVEDSKKLNGLKEPCIIISASGMCEFGRIRHHLKESLPDKKNTVMIVGFMAENTLGRRLLEGAKKVNILNQSVAVAAEIKVLNSLSAHADQRGLLDFIHAACPLKKVFLVHGEEQPIKVLADKLASEDIGEIVAPELGEKFELS